MIDKSCQSNNKIVGTGLVPVRTNKITDSHKGCPYTKNTKQNVKNTKKVLPQRKNPRLKNFDYSAPYIYFITICTKDKTNFFTDRDFSRRVIACLIAEGNRTQINIYAYCLMSNHIHLLISPGDSGFNISKFIGGFKSKTTRLGWKKGINKLWQDRFYDHILRKNENLNEVAQYILNNPVRKGLVQSYEDYEFCGIIDEIPL